MSRVVALPQMFRSLGRYFAILEFLCLKRRLSMWAASSMGVLSVPGSYYLDRVSGRGQVVFSLSFVVGRLGPGAGCFMGGRIRGLFCEVFTVWGSSAGRPTAGVSFFLVPSVLGPFFSCGFFTMLLRRSAIDSGQAVLFILTRGSGLLGGMIPVPFPLCFFGVPVAVCTM